MPQRIHHYFPGFSVDTHSRNETAPQSPSDIQPTHPQILPGTASSQSDISHGNQVTLPMVQTQGRLPGQGAANPTLPPGFMPMSAEQHMPMPPSGEGAPNPALHPGFQPTYPMLQMHIAPAQQRVPNSISPPGLRVQVPMQHMPNPRNEQEASKPDPNRGPQPVTQTQDLQPRQGAQSPMSPQSTLQQMRAPATGREYPKPNVSGYQFAQPIVQSTNAPRGQGVSTTHEVSLASHPMLQMPTVPNEDDFSEPFLPGGVQHAPPMMQRPTPQPRHTFRDDSGQVKFLPLGIPKGEVQQRNPLGLPPPSSMVTNEFARTNAMEEMLPQLDPMLSMGLEDNDPGLESNADFIQLEAEEEALSSMEELRHGVSPRYLPAFLPTNALVQQLSTLQSMDDIKNFSEEESLVTTREMRRDASGNILCQSSVCKSNVHRQSPWHTMGDEGDPEKEYSDTRRQLVHQPAAVSPRQSVKYPISTSRVVGNRRDILAVRPDHADTKSLHDEERHSKEGSQILNDQSSLLAKDFDSAVENRSSYRRQVSCRENVADDENKEFGRRSHDPVDHRITHQRHPSLDEALDKDFDPAIENRSSYRRQVSCRENVADHENKESGGRSHDPVDHKRTPQRHPSLDEALAECDDPDYGGRETSHADKWSNLRTSAVNQRLSETGCRRGSERDMPPPTREEWRIAASSGGVQLVPMWVQKTIVIPPHYRGCHHITHLVHYRLYADLLYLSSSHAHQSDHLVGEQLNKLLRHLESDLSYFRCGLAHFFLQHTSASLTINENYNSDVLEDVEMFLNGTVPEGKRAPWKHREEGPDDMPAHIKSTIVGCALTVPITSGHLNLGSWQGIWLCEHRDHGSPRRVVVTLTGT